MSDSVDRRGFLQAAAAGVAGGRLVRGPAGAVSPPHPDGARVRLSCNLYSFNDLLREGVMSLEEVITFCAEEGFAAVDPTGYYFGTYPEVPDPAYTHRIRRGAFLEGVDLSGTGVRNDFTLAVPEARAAEVALVKEWVPFAARLGAPVLRVFAGSGVPDGYDRAEVNGWVVDALRECAERAAEYGVMIVLQNHAEFLETADQVIAVLEAVDSDWLGLNLDVGSFPTGDPYADIRRAAPHAVTWQIKENVHRGETAEPTDLDRIAEIVRETGYHGYLPLETLGEGDPREKIPRFRARVADALWA